mgnify:CR=1 FL=1
MSIKIFENLNDCSKAAEQLSKTINKFDTASGKLHKSIIDLTTMDKRMKEDDSFNTLLKSADEVKIMIDYFSREIPAFKEVIESSKNNLNDYKNEINETINEIKNIYSEFSEIKTVFSQVSEIHDILNKINKEEFKADSESLKIALINFEDTYKNMNYDFARDIEGIDSKTKNIKTAIDEIEGLVRSFEKSNVSIHDSFNAFILTMKNTIDNSTDKFIKDKDELEEYFNSKIEQIQNDLKDGLFASQFQSLEKLGDQRLEKFVKLVSNMNKNLYKDIVSYFDQKVMDINLLNGNYDGNVQFKTIYKNEPMSIKELYEHNGGKLPLKVTNDSWLNKNLYYVVTKLQNSTILGYYIKEGKKIDHTKPPSLDSKGFYLVELTCDNY